MNRAAKHTVLAIFSLVILLATLFVYREIENPEELRSAKLGYPAYFLEQDFSAQYGKSLFFPTWDKIDLSGKSPIVKFRFGWMVADFILIFAACEGLVYILETLDFAIRKERKDVV